MGEQKQFDFPRASKLRALERVNCPGGGHVKSLLKALDAFARDATTCTETLKRISVSMGVSVSTAKRARAAAEQLGILTVFGCPSDGRSNTYQINWNVVFSLPDGITPQPRSKGEATPVKMTGDPGQLDRGPRSSWMGSQVKMTGVCRTDRIDQLNATVRPAEIHEDGEGDFENEATNKTPVEKSSRSGKPSGWWAWKVSREDLLDTKEMTRFFNAAVAAEVLSDSKLNRIRFVALTIHTKRQEDIRNPCGYMVHHMECGTWNYLSREAVRAAVAKTGYQLSPDEAREIRTPDQTRSSNNVAKTVKGN